MGNIKPYAGRPTHTTALSFLNVLWRVVHCLLSIETAKMASEAALCLLKNRGEINAVKRGLSGGVLTPAFCFGDALIGRLEKAGVHFRDEAGWPSPAHKNATPPSKI